MTEESMIEGGCACGAVRFAARGAPLRVGLCHCLTCRKAHAAAFNPFVVFALDQVEITGTLKAWSSTPGHERRFCPECGSRVAMRMTDGNEIELSIGSFDAVGIVDPQYESWVVRREPWQHALPVPQNLHDRLGA